MRFLKVVLAVLPMFAQGAWAQSTQLAEAAKFYKQGEDFADKEDYDHAIWAFTQAIALHPGYADAFVRRGVAYDFKKDGDRAIQDYTTAVGLDPKNEFAFYRRAIAYSFKHDYARAIQDETEALRLRPNDTALLGMRAGDCERKGDFDGTLRDYTELLRLKPDMWIYYEYRGNAHFLKGEFGPAIADLNQALSHDRTGSQLLFMQGLAYLYTPHSPAAREDLRQAVKASAGDVGNPIYEYGHYEAVLWLYLAGAKAGEKGAQAELRENAARLSLNKWPGPVIRLYLGETTPEGVVQAAGQESYMKCYASLYLGEFYALRREDSGALRFFGIARDVCDMNFWQRRAAQEELKQLEHGHK